MDLEALVQYAEKFGLAFQIRDDIIDITLSSEELGKTAGKDLAMHKSTYPALLGLEEAKEELQKVLDEALFAVQSLEDKYANFNGSVLQDLLDLMRLN